MLRQLGVATDSQFAQKGAAKNGEEIANIQRHDRQHPIDSSAIAFPEDLRLQSTHSKYPTPVMIVTYPARGTSTPSRQGVTVLT